MKQNGGRSNHCICTDTENVFGYIEYIFNKSTQRQKRCINFFYFFARWAPRYNLTPPIYQVVNEVGRTDTLLICTFMIVQSAALMWFSGSSCWVLLHEGPFAWLWRQNGRTPFTISLLILFQALKSDTDDLLFTPIDLMNRISSNLSPALDKTVFWNHKELCDPTLCNEQIHEYKAEEQALLAAPRFPSLFLYLSFHFVLLVSHVSCSVSS